MIISVVIKPGFGYMLSTGLILCLQRGGSALDGKYASVGFVTFLFGIFCAYWAQMTNRNAWAWFFFGLFLAPIAGVVLLYKNSQDRRTPKAG